jgi:hypothetical protein
VKRRTGVGKAAASEFSKQGEVEMLSQVVAALICGVDATLYASEDCIGSAGGAGLIFDVPKFKIGLMLRGDKREPVARGRGNGRIEVPMVAQAIVKFDDLGRREN